jgi:hypothetical protein
MESGFAVFDGYCSVIWCSIGSPYFRNFAERTANCPEARCWAGQVRYADSICFRNRISSHHRVVEFEVR